MNGGGGGGGGLSVEAAVVQLMPAVNRTSLYLAVAPHSRPSCCRGCCPPESGVVARVGSECF